MNTEIRTLLDEIDALNRLLEEIDKQGLDLKLITITGIYDVQISDLIRNSDNYSRLLGLSENKLVEHIDNLESLHLKILNYRLSLNEVLLTLQNIITHWYLSKIASNYCGTTYIEMEGFINEILQIIASLYGHEYLKDLGFIQLVTLDTPSISPPFSTKIRPTPKVEINKVAIVFHPFHLCRTIDTYLFVLHELGHIFKEHYIEKWRLWTPIVNKVLEFIGNRISHKKMFNKIRRYYRSWVGELFADFFSLSLTPKYFDAFKNRYGYMVQSRSYELYEIYPPLTVRLKFMLKSLEKLYKQTDNTYEKYIDEYIRQYSSDILAGFLDTKALEELLDTLIDRFLNIIMSNSENNLPYVFIDSNRDSFKHLAKILLIE
ncbi:MAG: hypothetical protein DRO40_08110 [Thermoprotei archaeon]|nr:MAG: hypothetical protein DRO40_08110 [Thermoprotei archaeon]